MSLRALALAGALLAAQAQAVESAAPAAAPQGPRGEAVYSLKLSPSAHGPNVLLADVLEEELPPALGSVAVKPAGAPGSSLQVDAKLVQLKLKHAGAGSLKPGPRTLSVKVAAQKIEGKVLQEFARAFLAEQLSGTAGASIEDRGKVMGLRLYDPPVRLRVRPPEQGSLRGDVVLRVEALQSSYSGEEKLVASVPASFLVRRKELRLFTTAAVRRGEPLGVQNLAAKEADATYMPEGFSDIKEVQGKVARAYIPAGQPLGLALVEAPLAIRRGDLVKLLVKSGAVSVEVQARALRDARVGESLPLQVTDTSRQVQARCVEPGTAVREAP